MKITSVKMETCRWKREKRQRIVSPTKARPYAGIAQTRLQGSTAATEPPSQPGESQRSPKTRVCEFGGEAQRDGGEMSNAAAPGAGFDQDVANVVPPPSQIRQIQRRFAVCVNGVDVRA